VLNYGLKTFDKNTGAPTAYSTSPWNFFLPVSGSASPFDPTVKFDRLSGRWFVMASTFSTKLVIAVSNAGRFRRAPRGASLPLPDQVEPAGDAGCTPDFPTWGLDAHALYVTFSLLSPCSGGNTFIIRKSTLLSGGPSS